MKTLSNGNYDAILRILRGVAELEASGVRQKETKRRAKLMLRTLTRSGVPERQGPRLSPEE